MSILEVSPKIVQALQFKRHTAPLAEEFCEGALDDIQTIKESTNGVCRARINGTLITDGDWILKTTDGKFTTVTNGAFERLYSTNSSKSNRHVNKSFVQQN